MTTCYEWYHYLFTPHEVFNFNSESFLEDDVSDIWMTIDFETISDTRQWYTGAWQLLYMETDFLGTINSIQNLVKYFIATGSITSKNQLPYHAQYLYK
jgi:hypothetical protein